MPLGTNVELRVRAPQSAAVVWSGAREVRRNTGFTVAEARFDQPGPRTVQVEISGLAEEDLVETVHFEVVDLGGQPVQVTGLRLTADQVVLDPERPNASSMQYFFRNGSIAKLTEDAPGYYVTSTERWVTAAAQVEPAGFAPLLEWRLDGEPLAQLGAQVQFQSFVAQEHVLEAGGEELTLETYRVHITSHESRTQIPDGVPVTFTARTEPPGYEDRITWLPSTKFGTCAPERGEGAELTVMFEGTTGAAGRWLGVRADGTSVAQDQKGGTGTIELELPGRGKTVLILPPEIPKDCACCDCDHALPVGGTRCVSCTSYVSGHCWCQYELVSSTSTQSQFTCLSREDAQTLNQLEFKDPETSDCGDTLVIPPLNANAEPPCPVGFEHCALTCDDFGAGLLDPCMSFRCIGCGSDGFRDQCCTGPRCAWTPCNPAIP